MSIDCRLVLIDRSTARTQTVPHTDRVLVLREALRKRYMIAPGASADATPAVAASNAGA